MILSGIEIKNRLDRDIFIEPFEVHNNRIQARMLYKDFQK